MQGTFTATTLEDLVAAIAAPRSWLVQLDELPLRPLCEPEPEQRPRGRRNAPQDTFMVWRAATAGCLVDGGTIELPESGVLLLTGRGVHFNMTGFTGGVVVCAGAQYSGTFQDCSFLSTAVYAVHGADVTLRGCDHRNSHPGVTASGAATYATLIDCSFTRCFTSVAVNRGAAARAHRCALQHTESAFTVNGSRSAAALASCDIRGAGGGDRGRAAVAVRGGGVMLYGCMLSDFHTGVLGVLRSTSIELHEVVITDSCTHSVVLARHARALARNCDFTSRTGTLPGGCGGCADAKMSADGLEREAAVAVGAAAQYGADSRARMQLERCSLRFKGARGVRVDGGGSLAATLCVSRAAREGLLVKEHGSRAVLAHCSSHSKLFCVRTQGSDAASLSDVSVRLCGGLYEGSSAACLAELGAKFTAVDCELRSLLEPVSRGVITVAAGAHAWLLRCNIHTGCIGVFVPEGTLCAVDTVVRDMRLGVPMGAGCACRPAPPNAAMGYTGAAGYMFAGGSGTVRGGQVQSCVVGLEVQSTPGRERRVTAHSVGFCHCLMGMEVIGDSEVDLTECEFIGPHFLGSVEMEVDLRNARHPLRAEVGVAYRGTKGGVVKECRFSGYEFNAAVDDQVAGVTFSDCEFMLVGEDGAIGIVTGGATTIEGCVFTGADGGPARGDDNVHGIRAEAASVCAVRRCKLDDLSGEPLLARQQSSMTVVDTIIDGGQEGLSVRHSATLAAQDCRISHVHTGAYVGGGVLNAKRVVFAATCSGVRGTSYRGDRVEVKLAECSLTGGTYGLCAEGALVDASLLRCRVSDTAWAVYVSHGARGRVKGSQLYECAGGVQAGSPWGELEYDCNICDREEGGALALEATAALVGSGGAGVEGAVCAHEGALAHVLLKDVEVHGCERWGVIVHNHCRVDADAVRVLRCGLGFSMQYVTRRSSFRGCAAIDCWRGTEEGQWSGDPEAALSSRIPEIEVVKSRPGGPCTCQN